MVLYGVTTGKLVKGTWNLSVKFLTTACKSVIFFKIKSLIKHMIYEQKKNIFKFNLNKQKMLILH